MADVVHRTTVQYLRSVNTPNYPSATWLINPDLSALSGVPWKYWKVSGETVVEMTQGEKDTVDAAIEVSRQAAIPLSHPSARRISPTADGEINILGWNIKTDAAASLTSAAPLTISEPAYHAHIVVDVSAASGLPFTIRVTGRSVNESTGATTADDTEDLAVTANGYYQSTKSWIDAVVISIVEASKSCTVDVYRTTYWDRGNTEFVVDGCRVEWTPDETVWSMRIVLWHVQGDGSLVAIEDTTFASTDTPPRAELNKPGKHKRLDYGAHIQGDNAEGLIVWVDQAGIGSFYFEVQLHG